MTDLTEFDGFIVGLALPNFRILTRKDHQKWLAELRDYFPGAHFGTLRDIKKATYGALLNALQEGGEEPIQQFLTKNPYVIQYAIPDSGHHGIWVFPKQTIKPNAQNGVDGGRGIVQCQKYLNHFNNYIDAVRANIQAPELVQPKGAILLIGDSEAESIRQNELRANFESQNPRISVVSYRRLLHRLGNDLNFKTRSREPPRNQEG